MLFLFSKISYEYDTKKSFVKEYWDISVNDKRGTFIVDGFKGKCDILVKNVTAPSIGSY